MEEYFRQLESELGRLVDELSVTISDDAMILIRELIEAGEYGVSLETLVNFLHEEGKRVTPTEYVEILRLASKMRVDNGWPIVEFVDFMKS